MIFKIISFVAMITFFSGCSDDAVTDTQSSLVTPQPSVEDESIRPPKPPAI